ncbi:hypothetical protein L7F22_054599 [Adiantum nelumboides]|nr:hypothetical protein [Adiantum nelumboides]
MPSQGARGHMSGVEANCSSKQGLCLSKGGANLPSQEGNKDTCQEATPIAPKGAKASLAKGLHGPIAMQEALEWLYSSREREMEAADVAANRAARRDEAEVLKSIYGEDCVFHNDNSCEILVRPSEEGGIVPLRLCIHFPESYPVTSEPILEMEAPWLKQEIRQKLSRELQTIYQENAGCVVVFTWVEWIKSHMRVSPSDARTVTWGWRWVNMLWEVKISALPAGVKETDGTAEFATVQQSKFDFVFPLKSHR